MSKPRTLPASLSTARTATPATLRYKPICLRLDDAAELIGVSDSKVKRLVREKRIHSFQIDGCTVVLYEDLRSFAYSAAGRLEHAPADPLAPELGTADCTKAAQ